MDWDILNTDLIISPLLSTCSYNQFVNQFLNPVPIIPEKGITKIINTHLSEWLGTITCCLATFNNIKYRAIKHKFKPSL